MASNILMIITATSYKTALGFGMLGVLTFEQVGAKAFVKD